MSAPQSLRRFIVPRTHPFPYPHAQAIQEKLVSEFLSYKAIISSRDPPKELPPAPLPAVFAFTPEPVYTTGRREVGTLTASQIRQLKEPLFQSGQKHVARICETKRGGQITFHGPGQVVFYPILDIKSIRSERFPNGMTARQYVEVLELTTIEALKQYNIFPFRTEDPGVWVTNDQKIAAVGVHLRRNISSFGVAVNLDTDLRWFDRIVACGLEGKRMTSILEQTPDTTPRKFSKTWVDMFAIQLWGQQDGRATYSKVVTKQVKVPLPSGEGFSYESVTETKQHRRVQGFTFEGCLDLLRDVADVDTSKSEFDGSKSKKKRKPPPKKKNLKRGDILQLDDSFAIPTQEERLNLLTEFENVNSSKKMGSERKQMSKIGSSKLSDIPRPKDPFAIPTFEERLHWLGETKDVDTKEFELKDETPVISETIQLSNIPHLEAPFDTPPLANREALLEKSEEAVRLFADDSHIKTPTELFPSPNPHDPDVTKQPVRWKEVHEVEPVGIEESDPLKSGGSYPPRERDWIPEPVKRSYPVYPMGSNLHKNGPVE